LLAATASGVQRRVDSRGSAGALILQAFSWGQCSADAQASGNTTAARYPTAAEMLAMRDAALQHSAPKLLLWYDFDETAGWPAGEMPADCSAPSDTGRRLAALTAAVSAPYPSAAPTASTARAHAARKRSTARASRSSAARSRSAS
jgi:hypothetical protein